MRRRCKHKQSKTKQVCVYFTNPYSFIWTTQGVRHSNRFHLKEKMYLFMSHNSILKVTQQVLGVPQVAVRSSLCCSITQLFHNGQIRSRRKKVGYILHSPSISAALNKHNSLMHFSTLGFGASNKEGIQILPYNWPSWILHFCFSHVLTLFSGPEMSSAHIQFHHERNHIGKELSILVMFTLLLQFTMQPAEGITCCSYYHWKY